MATLLLILGDQLSPDLATLRDGDPERDVVFMAEARREATYVPHHPKKIALVFSAMRHFALELAEKGWTLDYLRYEDNACETLTESLEQAVKRHGSTRVLVTEPGEYRLLKAIRGWRRKLDVSVEILEDDRFFHSRGAFAEWAAGRKQLRLEHFYRKLRRETGYLMDGDEPAGGRWNYDSMNRKPPEKGMEFPEPPRPRLDDVTREVLDLVQEEFADHFGDLEPFRFAVTRSQALAALRHFIEERLDRFGDYQDAMVSDEPYLYHSLLSMYINLGLLSPREVCDRVQEAWSEGRVPINAAEGFIRQILGWREFIRGIYWLRMPGYTRCNALEAGEPLPQFYWGSGTRMRCIDQAVSQTQKYAYAHHIQRLMVTGNFAMLLGVKPAEVHEWYLSVYADAYEWVEAPNTLGMSQFADGGVFASKPYAASGSYINRMSDYCSNCHYRAGTKNGDQACPFNYLYWDFMRRNRSVLSGNPRLGNVYRQLDTMDARRKRRITQDAKALRSSIRAGDPV